MPLKKRKFIDKKKSVTFRLVHRSQKDPLVAVDDAPQHVLFKCEHNQVKSKKQREEQNKFGIYYDDDYDYLQHLRDVKTTPEWVNISSDQVIDTSRTDQVHKEKFDLNLPSSVFQSCVEESEGLLNKAAPNKDPKIDWDPDIVAALDDDNDFDSDNELEDDFITLANQQDSEQQDYCSRISDLTEEQEEEEDDDDDDLSSDSLDSEEYKNDITNYSMSSSVLPRSKNLHDVDDHFEKFLEKYDEDGIGSLDCDDIQGYIKPDSELLQKFANCYAEEQDNSKFKDIIMSKQVSKNTQMSSDEEFIEITVNEKPTDNWDCESIISTYSTTSNRPKIIEEPKKVTSKILVSSSSGLPKGTLGTRHLTASALRTLDHGLNSSSNKDIIGSRSMISNVTRNKNETPSEKKERKSIVKLQRRERRVEKKANQSAFKEEEQRQEKVMQNLRVNLSGIKLL